MAWISKFVLSEFAAGEIEKRPSKSEVMIRKERRVRIMVLTLETTSHRFKAQSLPEGVKKISYGEGNSQLLKARIC